MKYYFYIFFSFFFATSLAQESNILVEYEYENLYYKNTETLIANRKNAKIITGELKKMNNSNYIKDSEGNYEVFQKNIFIRKQEIYTTSSNNISYIKMPYNKKEILFVKDSIKEIEWILIPNETKKIGNYICSKAKIKFRGREYIAYYTSEIPIAFGPWKFKGLPGLILQVYNTEEADKFIWTAKNIIYPFEDDTNLLWEKTLNKDLITLEKLIKREDDKRNEDNNVSKARLPKDVELVSAKTVRRGKELIYEWEEEKQ